LEGENMVIQSNISAANASRQYGIANKNISVSMEKLSSGYRINRAADDAAGLSISENMRKQIRGLSRGVENTEDGVSLCQVADGALSEMTDMIQRLNELSVQAANGTNSTSDRRAIQDEIDQITDDVDRISESTTFNGQKIFDGQPVYIGGGTR
jgi:flagellin